VQAEQAHAPRLGRRQGGHARNPSPPERARKALRGDDMGEIRSAQEELASAFQEAGRSFYAQQQSSPPPGGEPQPGEPAGATSSQKPDDVVEADYEIVDEGKK